MAKPKSESPMSFPVDPDEAPPVMPEPAVVPETAKRKVRPMDAELQTMAKIDRLLADHDESAATRIVQWLVGRRMPGRWRMVIGSENESAGQ